MKYSENLAKFFKRNPGYNRVFFSEINGYGDKGSSWTPNLMYVGMMAEGWLHGARLNSILCGDKNRWAIPMKPASVIDITDEFNRQYTADGRCAFDREHRIYFANSDDRFTEIGATRRCNWCGEWHNKSIKKRVKIERRPVWIPAAALVPAAPVKEG